jgi:hypothetical protein
MFDPVTVNSLHRPYLLVPSLTNKNGSQLPDIV